MINAVRPWLSADNSWFNVLDPLMPSFNHCLNPLIGTNISWISCFEENWVRQIMASYLSSYKCYLIMMTIPYSLRIIFHQHNHDEFIWKLWVRLGLIDLIIEFCLFKHFEQESLRLHHFCYDYVVSFSFYFYSLKAYLHVTSFLHLMEK